MTPLVFWYAHDQGVEHLAATPDEIDAALDHVASLADKGGVVTTITRLGVETDGLFAGVNGDVGTLNYVMVGAGYFSQGDQPADGEPLHYDWQWNVYDFPPDAEIPIADVRAAVHEYARTGIRPTDIRWQEWEPPSEPGGTIIADDDPAWG